jgi:hypothetical protein
MAFGSEDKGDEGALEPTIDPTVAGDARPLDGAELLLRARCCCAAKCAAAE